MRIMENHLVRWAYKFTKKGGGNMSAWTGCFEHEARERFRGCRGKPIKVRIVPDKDYHYMMHCVRECEKREE